MLLLLCHIYAFAVVDAHIKHGQSFKMMRSIPKFDLINHK